VGGTWYWNRYPGARFDSESYTYGYSFSEELLQEWDWKEHYSGQPENERYLNYVADKFDLRRDIRFHSRVASAVFDEGEARWQVHLEDGHRARAQFLITAVGSLSAYYIPDFEGLDSFQGAWCHTGRWPKDGMDVAGKRVGVIGTGATGYDAVTGPLNRIAIHGEGGQTLQDKFAAGPRTYLGLQSVGFPNLFTINAASVGNFVRAAEPLVDWVSDCIGYVRAQQLTRIAPTPEAEAAWTQHVAEAGAKILRTQADSWFVAANIPGKARVLLTSPDSAPVMRAKRAEVAAKGYAGFLLQ
jgi:cation diffusion facilitator CzcD-associated flavoprotein CzcO